MIYRVTHFVNFAQGELALCSTYVAWAMVNAGVPYWLAFVATLVMSFAMGVFVERVVIRPAMRAPALVGRDRLHRTHGDPQQRGRMGLRIHDTRLPEPLPDRAALRQSLPGFARARHHRRHARDAARSSTRSFDSPRSVSPCAPWPTTRSRAAWSGSGSRGCSRSAGGSSSVVGAVAGMMIAPIVFLDPSMMSGVMLYAFAAALLGGIDSPVGAVAGGFTVGILENLVGTYVVGTELKLTTALALIVGVLIFRPAGLFGQPSAARV